MYVIFGYGRGERDVGHKTRLEVFEMSPDSCFVEGIILQACVEGLTLEKAAVASGGRERRNILRIEGSHPMTIYRGRWDGGRIKVFFGG
jgi:hypothetical protein